MVILAATTVVGLLSAATLAVLLIRTYRRPRRLPDAFRCKLAVAAPNDIGAVRWRRTSYAMWVHDVLIEFGGVLRTRVRAYPVHFADGAPLHELSPALARLGPSPTVLALELDDGGHLLLAAARVSAALAAGPFLAALVVYPPFAR